MLLSPSPDEVKSKKELHCTVIFYEHMQMERCLCLSFLVTAVLPLVSSCCTWIGCVCLCMRLVRVLCNSMCLCVIFKQAYPFVPAYQGSPCVCVCACVCVHVITGKKLRLNSCHTALLLLGFVLFCSAWEWWRFAASCFCLGRERTVEEHGNSLQQRSCVPVTCCCMLQYVHKHLLQLKCYTV